MKTRGWRGVHRTSGYYDKATQYGFTGKSDTPQHTTHLLDHPTLLLLPFFLFFPFGASARDTNLKEEGTYFSLSCPVALLVLFVVVVALALALTLATPSFLRYDDLVW